MNTYTRTQEPVICPKCHEPVKAGDPRVSWFTEDQGMNVTDRGAVHLHCLI